MNKSMAKSPSQEKQASFLYALLQVSYFLWFFLKAPYQFPFPEVKMFKRQNV